MVKTYGTELHSVVQQLQCCADLEFRANAGRHAAGRAVRLQQPRDLLRRARARRKDPQSATGRAMLSSSFVYCRLIAALRARLGRESRKADEEKTGAHFDAVSEMTGRDSFHHQPHAAAPLLAH